MRELLLIVALFAAYKLGRLFAGGRAAEAFGNAREVWHLERTLRLPSETGVQHGLLHSDALVHAANSYYAFVHFPAAVAFLLWMYLRRPRHYRWIRRVLVGLTSSALVLHLLVPLAPPRMLPSTGLIDTAARFGPAVYGATRSPTSTRPCRPCTSGGRPSSRSGSSPRRGRGGGGCGSRTRC